MSNFIDRGHRYQLTRRIATGGMGEVWRATDTVLGREIAVKILKAEYADDPGFRARFETEARHAAALHHPNVAAVFDFGDGEDGRPFLVMELVEGQPLSALLRPGKQMPPEQARELLGQAADALAAAHAKGIVHRDVKPANLMVTPDRQVKITDFGIARAADGMALTQTGQVMGTPQYLAPEQAEGGKATSASDVYSLGVVLYECLAGRRPFTGDSPVATALAHIREPVPALPANVPGDLAAVVMRSLAKKPKERFRNAAEFATALRNPSSVRPLPPTETVKQGQPTAVLTGLAPAGGILVEPTGPVRRPPRKGVSPWWTLVPIVLLLGLIAWVFWENMNDDGSPSDDTRRRRGQRSPRPRRRPSTRASSSPRRTADGSIDKVTGRLEGMDLAVLPDEQENPGGEKENDVIGCTPIGSVQPGELITVSYWGPEPTETEPTDTPTTETTAPTETASEPAAAGNDAGNGNSQGRTRGNEG